LILQGQGSKLSYQYDNYRISGSTVYQMHHMWEMYQPISSVVWPPQPTVLFITGILWSAI